MIRKIEKPTIIKAAGNLTKKIEEFVGRVNSGTEQVSIARMVSPAGWQEPAQTPEFDEYTVVLKGTLQVKNEGETLLINTGQAIFTPRGETVQYSTPQGAEYIAVCLPAFSPDRVHRETK